MFDSSTTGDYQQDLVMLFVFATLLLSTFLISSRVNGDCFMHNPRGSNNRLDGDQANRGSNNRIFDSQVSFAIISNNLASFFLYSFKNLVLSIKI